MSREIEETVALLVMATDYSKVVTDLTNTVEAANKIAADYPACFRALIDLGLKDRDAFEKVIQRTQQERLTNPDVKRQDYQRLLMRKRRARFAKMSAIARIKEPSATSMRIKAAVKEMNKTMNAERAAYMGEHKDDEDFNNSAAVAAYWEDVDKKLDDYLAKLRKAKL